MRFFQRVADRGYGDCLQFRYTNWHGVEHVYVVEPESVEVGHYDAAGFQPSASFLAVVLHAQVKTRDGEPRPGRRTFMANGLRDLVWID